MTLTIDILKPKAKALLKSMEDDKLISIKSPRKDEFAKVLETIRKKNVGKRLPTLAEITEEVEIVRGNRYATKK